MEEYYKYSNGELLKGRYAKVADLSEGSYGLVSVAKDTKVGTLVAVKYIYPLDYKKDQTRPSSSPAKMRHDLHKHENKHSDKNYTNDDDNHHHHQKQQHERQNTHEILKSLYEEAAKEISIHKILGSHQNVSALYDHFDSYLILQYCSRGDLYEAIQNGQGPATPKDIKDVFYQILDALEYCHSKGVYHRDLKPENILIDEDWSIKLCDWGLATTNLTITNKNEFDIGSERYMAPELFDNNLNSYDSSKIDIWSIGIILLTIVFHKNPFEIANYSDKRFVQFATNRESLFDIFSTMTGDLFSVLRYCLNIDPNNRDLVYVRNELEILNYFTIDDEDWVSGDDYYTDDELNYDHHEDKESLDIAIAIEDVDEHQGHQNIMGKTSEIDEHGVTNEEEGEDDDEDDEDDDENALEELELGEEANYSPDTAVDDDEGESTFYMDEDADKSNSTLNKEILEAPKEILLPTYNERAEALLSNSTTLKPIPINNNGGNNVRSKFFRNSRKPIGVASYNSYQKTAYGSNTYNNNNNFNNFNNFSNFNNNYSSSNYNNGHKKFNREDFFTPKSVFNHYMNKYSEKNERSVKPNNWKKNNKPRTWKRNYRNTRHKKKNNHNNYNGSSNNAGNGNPQSNSHHYHKKEFSNFNSPIQPRKKSDSFSSSKSKVRHHVVGSYQSTNSTFQNNNFQNSVSSNSNGKYVPPFMRSPNYVKSPNILPLNEAIDNLNLNDYEVFQLEDDDDFTLDTNKTQLNNINLNQTHQDDDKGHYKVFDKPKYMHDNDNETNSATNTNTNITNNTNDRPMSLNNDLASTSNGKYVPPFRRGSLSGHSQPVSITNNLNNYNNHNHVNHNNSYKRRSRHYMDTFNQLNDGASSVPGSSTDWFSYRKDWSVYD